MTNEKGTGIAIGAFFLSVAFIIGSSVMASLYAYGIDRAAAISANMSSADYISFMKAANDAN